jgi:hypothetical protein
MPRPVASKTVDESLPGSGGRKAALAVRGASTPGPGSSRVIIVSAWASAATRRTLIVERRE